jgi:hypothetical protein
MGQAAVDLPDTPNPAAASPASAASTDDLLAQMAGEEIDRLLAEADGERSPQAPKAPPAKADPAPAAAKQTPSVSLPEVASESDASQLQGFLGGLASDAGPDPVAELAGVSRSEACGTAHPVDRSDPLEEEEAAANAERGALHASAAVDEGATEPAAAAAVPVLVRVLSWMNSPLDSCPDHVREAVGKVAILTAVNAVSVLVYVLFFRHH